MTRLDELYAMRAKIDAEIRKELDALRDVGELRDEVRELLATAPTATARTLLAVSEAYDVPVEVVTGKSRERHTVEARHITSWLLHRQRVTYTEIGRTFGQDHTTAIHAVSRVNNNPRLLAAAHGIAAALAPVQAVRRVS